jgi:hypothetical protein
MEQDATGHITLPDGVQAKRCVYLEQCIEDQKPKAVHTGMNKHDLTFSLGFSKKQLPEMQEAARRDGLTGVEFYPDPQNSNMIGIRCGSEAEKERYIKHRGKWMEGGLVNRTGSLGGGMGKECLEMAEKLVRERYGKEEAERRPTAGTAEGESSHCEGEA